MLILIFEIYTFFAAAERSCTSNRRPPLGHPYLETSATSLRLKWVPPVQLYMLASLLVVLQQGGLYVGNAAASTPTLRRARDDEKRREEQTKIKISFRLAQALV